MYLWEDSDSESEDSDDSNDAGLGLEIAQCELLLAKVPRGRPTKKRKRKDDIRRPRQSIPTFPASFQDFHRRHHRTAYSVMK